ncbi:hypothetical protein EK21DRAFT_65304 [Setomelanomma holmii]|uniref:Nuclear pore complex protein Nup85 n=1 Tax=Setomelanomma holmii TaxID=210430 RepID=A0A9P4H9E3_9PLEO|nr:hypothetical protein EK21DRAFT_65304 [Setomelanomma holmii]
MFRVPSSTPPSTPGSRRSSRHGPSTTPAGPPPDQSLGPSSTPAGAPPGMGSLFGSTKPLFKPGNYSHGNSLFGSSPPKNGVLEGIGSGHFRASSTGRPAAQRGRTTSSSGYQVPSSSPPPDDEDAEGEEDEDMEDEEYEDEEDDDMDDDDEDDQPSALRRAKPQNRFSQSVASRTSANELEPGPALVRVGATQSKFDLLAIAKGITPPLDRATLQESDHVILETERLVEKVHDSLHSDTPERRTEVLGQVSRDLVSLWQAASKTKGNLSSSRSGGVISLAQATRLASLLLSIHHPPPLATNQRTSALSLIPVRPDSKQYTPLPKILLDWLNTSYADVSEIEQVLKETRGYSRHTSFWEAVQAAAVRGNFNQALQLLQGAKLEVAATAQEDGLGDTGYSGTHLRYANEAVRASIDLLRECPAIASEDWDVKGHDWSIFRQRIQQAYQNLQDFAEGDSASRHAVSQPFTASHFGISQSQANFQLSVASRKAESKVPWLIYENLRKLYQLMLGNEEEILDISTDWIEAVMCLTIWWNGEEDDLGQGSLAASRRTIMRTQRVRSVDVTPVKAYCKRLASSLAAVIENSDEDFSVNTTDRFEVGLACIIDDNIEGALQILSGWSVTIASAVTELASVGEWFTRANGIMDHFDQSDLMVLSYTEQQRTGSTKDDFLLAYSKLLATKGQLKDQNGEASKDGWELAIQVLGRLDDSIMASGRVEQILNELSLESSVRVDKITRLCHDLGLSQHALTIALTLTKLASLDSEAATILSNHLSGYATIRKFYDLRDEQILLSAGQNPTHRPMARKRAAANALSVIIASAASSIRGGLYDPEIETVVQVDVLLPLLAEALVFVNQPKRTLTLKHLYGLLAAIEDLDTAPSMIRSQCEEVLQTTLAAAHDSSSSPRHLTKSTSNLTTASSQYSLLGSTDFGSQDGQSTEGSAVLVRGGHVDDSKRGWDWRRGFPRGASGGDIIKVLRLGIAREIGRAFVEGEVNA